MEKCEVIIQLHYPPGTRCSKRNIFFIISTFTNKVLSLRNPPYHHYYNMWQQWVKAVLFSDVQYILFYFTKQQQRIHWPINLFLSSAFVRVIIMEINILAQGLSKPRSSSTWQKIDALYNSFHWSGGEYTCVYLG